MNSNLLFDFSVNRENKTIDVKREFASGLSMVWEAWTNPELLDQWWAPKPWRAETRSLDFTEGGKWHYAMVGPEGDRQWCLFDYESIDHEKAFSGVDAFCDENAVADDSKPRMKWNNTFVPADDKTLVHIKLTFDELADLEAIIEMGFKEGFTMGLQNLDELLETMPKQNKG